MTLTLEKLINNFNSITDKPENFISNQADHSIGIKEFVKDLYDFTKNEEEEKSQESYALPALIIEEFDLEQIWQQIELQNENLLQKSLTKVPKFVVTKNRLLFNELDKDSPLDKDLSDKEDSEESGSDDNDPKTSELPNTDGLNESNEDEEESIDEIDDDEELSNGENEVDPGIKKKVGNPSVVDDDFFKLDEMEQFLKAEEKELNKKPEYDSGNDSNEDEESEIDYFQRGSDLDDENGEESLREKNPRYKDFFRQTETTNPIKRNKFLEEEEKEENQERQAPDDENKDPPKSTFELREDRLKNKIKIIENIVLSEKPWQLQGEITAESRPQNSLLEEIVEFDLTSRPAPVITEKTTFQLEDIIRQRIKDKVFDSVERKEKPVETPLEYKKKLVLNQEKSKESLAQIYEKEYLQQVDTISGNAEEKEEEEPQLHKDIKKMMQTLFRQLDALSNYHFTPKPAAPELRIVSNLPAINMEEVAPVAATDASLLAPEEVKRRIKGDVIGKSERTDTDKKRERRKKKIKQQIHAKLKNKKEDIISKMKPGLGNKYSKEKIRKQLEKLTKDKNVDKMDESVGSKSLKSSSAFFKQLEEEIKTQIKNKTQPKRKQNTKGISAKKMKL